VNLKTAADFIKAGAAALGVGADLVQGERAAITEKAKQFVEIVRQARDS
jgi:2-dehydro-3-deoxyphosphogluconate aldolase/(4S)-4-hydroxy-2-oxoglutarate aldolase